MANTIIPAGYRITCVSWENDGDNYRTKFKEGLSISAAQLYVDLALLLTIRKGCDFGNMYEPSDDELEKLADAVSEVLHKHGITDVQVSDKDEVTDYFFDVMYDFTGASEHYCTRVVESIKVEYIPLPIELTDVTAEFIK